MKNILNWNGNVLVVMLNTKRKLDMYMKIIIVNVKYATIEKVIIVSYH